MIFHSNSEKENYIKRVIATSGDTIKFENGAVLLKQAGSTDFKVLDESYLSERSKGKTLLPQNVKESEFTIPDGQYFVMGDNRNSSSDSRNCFLICGIKESTHYVKQEEIVGKVLR